MRIGEPVATAGVTLWATRLRGKLKGLIPSTPPCAQRMELPIPVLPGACEAIDRMHPDEIARSLFLFLLE